MKARFLAILVSAGLLTSTAAFGAGIPECEPGSRSVCATGVAITGNNNLRGTTVFSFDGIGAVTFGQFVGAWNPGGDLPAVIDETTAGDAILATIAPPGFPLYGENAPNIPFQNLRFQDVPTIVSPAGDIGPIPSIAEAGVLERSFGPLKSDYTLGQWLAAEGELKMECGVGGGTDVRMEFAELVPNGGVYTLWAFWAAGGPGPVVLPFGGAGTNSFTTDRDGGAEVSVTLPYCALDDFGGVELVAVQLDFHSDDGLTGAFPNLPLVPGRGPGIIGHSAMIFAVRGIPCEIAGDCVSRP